MFDRDLIASCIEGVAALKTIIDRARKNDMKIIDFQRELDQFCASFLAGRLAKLFNDMGHMAYLYKLTFKDAYLDAMMNGKFDAVWNYGTNMPVKCNFIMIASPDRTHPRVALHLTAFDNNKPDKRKSEGSKSDGAKPAAPKKEKEPYIPRARKNDRRRRQDDTEGTSSDQPEVMVEALEYIPENLVDVDNADYD